MRLLITVMRLFPLVLVSVYLHSNIPLKVTIKTVIMVHAAVSRLDVEDNPDKNIQHFLQCEMKAVEAIYMLL